MLALTGHGYSNAGDLLAIGDSVTAAAGANSLTKSWAGLLATHDGLILVDLAQSGSGVADYAVQAYPGYTNVFFGSASPAATTRGQKVVLLAGYNDMRDWGTNAIFIEHFTRTLDATVGWLAIPDIEKIPGLAAHVTGKWKTITNLGGIGIESLEAGASISLSRSGTSIYVVVLSRSFPGTPLIIGKSGQPMTTGGEFGVTIDGNPAGKISCHDAYGNRGAFSGQTGLNIPLPVDYAPHLFRFGGLGPRIHQIMLTVISNSTPSTFLWASGSDAFGNHSTLPEVRAGETLPMTTNNYLAHSVAGSLEAVKLFNSRIQTIAERWFDDGASVGAVPIASYDPATMVSSDQVHPAQTGHTAIFTDFASPAWAQIRISLENGLETLAAPGSVVSLARSGDLKLWQSIPFASVSLLSHMDIDSNVGSQAFRISR